MDMHEALRLMAAKSPQAARAALGALFAFDRALQARYNQAALLALVDLRATLSEAEREEIAALIQHALAQTGATTLTIRLTDDEYVELELRAESRGQTLSDYARDVLFGRDRD